MFWMTTTKLRNYSSSFFKTKASSEGEPFKIEEDAKKAGEEDEEVGY